ncbi:peptidoglycan recognition protein family protein [Bacillus solitudinis]|uniref:peptidoglycan recognition protein family protein n=1 Tax=Bacillus solitudinis TaxID=2014074 RepID=UPI000C242EF4|nr:peptidoglycan recognition family protein [Bacillus solitudinis]
MNIVDIRTKTPRHPTKKLTYRKLEDIRSVIVHHGLTLRKLAGTNMESYLNFHITKNNWSIGGYPLGVEPDGTIKLCADFNIITPHVGNSNKHSLGICLPGDFRFEDPTDPQYQGLLWLLAVYLPEKLPNAFEIKGHSEMPGYSWKACPVINMDKVRADVVKYKNGIDINKEEDDNMTKTQLAPVIKILEIWTDARQRNPLNKSWLEKAKRGEMTVANCMRLEFEAKVRGLKNSL